MPLKLEMSCEMKYLKQFNFLFPSAFMKTLATQITMIIFFNKEERKKGDVTYTYVEDIKNKIEVKNAGQNNT